MSSCTVLSTLSVIIGEFSRGHRDSARIASSAAAGDRHDSSTSRRVCLLFGGPSVGAVALTTDIST
eukprot:30612-Pelagococcus_subviridis.AAC.29